MKIRIAIIAVLLCSFGMADEKAPSKTAPPKGEKTDVIPSGARQVSPNVWSHTAADGKTYLYRKTPFGVFKMDESKKEPENKPEPVPVGMKVTEKGDTLHFERRTPFGPVRWERKKTELTDMEKAAWERSRAAGADKKAGGQE